MVQDVLDEVGCRVTSQVDTPEPLGATGRGFLGGRNLTQREVADIKDETAPDEK